MSATSFLARRYLQAGRSNRFFSWISVLTITGVAIGVAAMIVVWSVINGFESQLRQRFLASNAHIMAYHFPYGLTNEDSWARTIEKDFAKDVRGVSPFVHYETMIRKDSTLHSVVVRGIPPKRREKVQSLAAITHPAAGLAALQKEIDDGAAGKPAPQIPAIIVGSGLMSLLHAQLGDQVQLVEPQSGDLGKMKAFRIVGVYDSGLRSFDNKLAIMSLPTAQRFFDMGNRVTGLEIGLKNPWDSPAIAEQMARKYTLSIREWQSLNRPLFDAMETERVVILLITSLVATVASFNILTTIFVAVSQRQRDVSILKAIGASNVQILVLFLKQGLYIGVAGGLLGMILALGISELLEHYQFIDLPDLYLLARLPISYDSWVYASVGGVSLAIAVAASLVPAWMASRVNPASGFRENQGAA